MYQFSRGVYRELLPLLDRCYGERSAFEVRLRLLRACEASVERLVRDREYFARPTQTLFGDVRCYFSVCRQEQVLTIVDRYMVLADEFVSALPRHGVDSLGHPLQCRALTRRGTACQRNPLPVNGYCPSHRHLAATEDCEAHPRAA